MKVDGNWLEHPGTQALCMAMEVAGYKALFVGGCVRNAILGETVNDVDIATDALPETVTLIAEKAGFKVVPTGIEHGTVTVIAEGRPHEVTTFRRDVETDGRRAIVAFSTHIEDDAARRDFTMNALYADRTGILIDPLNGLPDLIARQVRFVGNASERIQEDYLRILRFFRFHAYYGREDQGIDPAGLAACAEYSAGIETLSKERVGAEMRKLLLAPNPVPSVSIMAVAGVLARVLPGANPKALGPFLDLCEQNSHSANVIARLVALGGEAPDDALRLSRSETRNWLRLRDAAGSLASPGELGYQLGQEDGLTALLLRAAFLETPVVGVTELQKGAAAVFPVKAADLPGLSGANLGRELKRLERRWIASGFLLSRADLVG
ncbi:CCA tRNA nucleotidyltransferase [Thioclava sp. FR2]|uniref:CCA tRNA nucleotidyltransferase n=1 Tax=Thioclava sp. FR2 TaxID=3445780 RepID=UPI003EBA47BB